MIYSSHKQKWIIKMRNLDSTDPPEVLLVIIYSLHKQDLITDRRILDATDRHQVLSMKFCLQSA